MWADDFLNVTLQAIVQFAGNFVQDAKSDHNDKNSEFRKSYLHCVHEKKL